MAEIISNQFTSTVLRTTTSGIQEILSNQFTTTINRSSDVPGSLGDSLSTVVNIYKAGALLTPVNSTPTTGQYQVTITGTTGCTASLQSDHKTIKLNSITDNKGSIDISINIENKRTYTKSIPVAAITSTQELNSSISKVEQATNSFKVSISENLANNYYKKSEIDYTVNGLELKFKSFDNKINNNVITLDTNGITVSHSDGSKSVMDSNALNFYDSSNKLYQKLYNGKMQFTTPDGTAVGYLGRGYWSSDPSIYLTAVNAEYGHTVGLGAQYSSGDAYQTPLVVSSKDQSIGSYAFKQGLNLAGYVSIIGTLRFYSGYSAVSSTSAPSTISATSDGKLYIWGDNNIYLGVNYDGNTHRVFEINEDSSALNKGRIDARGNLNMNNFSVINSYAYNALSADSPTSTYSARDDYSDPNAKTITNIYSIHSADKGDVRWSDRCTYHTSETENGVYECYVEIPYWIAQNIENDYHVNITCVNGFYQYYVSERDQYYFTVRSDKEAMGFTFEIVAKLLESNTTDNNAVIANDISYMAIEDS